MSKEKDLQGLKMILHIALNSGRLIKAENPNPDQYVLYFEPQWIIEPIFINLNQYKEIKHLLRDKS